MKPEALPVVGEYPRRTVKCASYSRRRIFMREPVSMVRRTEAFPIACILYETSEVTTVCGSSRDVFATSSREGNRTHASSAKNKGNGTGNKNVFGEEGTAEYVGTTGELILPKTTCKADDFNKARMEEFLLSDITAYSGRDWNDFRWLLGKEGEDSSPSSQPSFGTLRQPPPLPQAQSPPYSSKRTTPEILLAADSSSRPLPQLQQSSPMLTSQRATSLSPSPSNFKKPPLPLPVPVLQHATSVVPSVTKKSPSFATARSVLPSVSQPLRPSSIPSPLNSQLLSANTTSPTSNSALQSFSQSAQLPSPTSSKEHPKTLLSLPSSPKPLTPLSLSHSSQMYPVKPKLSPPQSPSPNLQRPKPALSPLLPSRAPSPPFYINTMDIDYLGIMAAISEYRDPKLEEDLRTNDNLFEPIDY